VFLGSGVQRRSIDAYSYLSRAVSTEDLGTANQVQKAMSHVLDGSGNVTQTKVYNYENLPTFLMGKPSKRRPRR